MLRKKTSESFSSTDVYLTAALSAAGKHHDNVTTESGRLTFHWTVNPSEARILADEYYKKMLNVDARTMSDEIRSLKTLCHNPVVEE